VIKCKITKLPRHERDGIIKPKSTCSIGSEVVSEGISGEQSRDENTSPLTLAQRVFALREKFERVPLSALMISDLNALLCVNSWEGSAAHTFSEEDIELLERRVYEWEERKKHFSEIDFKKLADDYEKDMRKIFELFGKL